jgi:hypothetical protein
LVILTGYLGDEFEVGVVVHHGQVTGFGGGAVTVNTDEG